ncbi:DUF7461 family protein [Mycobacteroides abscessus]|uniref:DUF7461 family protein n=1 Tax=Mycobacteroides abscessus TaxID=36809 RepID=UPI000C255D8C
MGALSAQIADLQSKWKHACRLAIASVGQPDRVENVAYRDELAEQLAELKARARSIRRLPASDND